MSKEERRVPELRFKGFHDDWEQRELQSVVSITGGATPLKSNPSYWGGPIEWLSSQEIKNKYVSRGTYSITQKAIDEKTTKLIGSGIPLIVSRSGILARRFPISITTKSMAINQDIKALVFNRKLFTLDYFFAQLQSNEKFILKSIVKTGTTVQSISMPDFNKIMLTIPNLDEQGRIGRFFSATDKIIELHQRKINILNTQKEVYFRKVLVEKNKNIPILRFKNFHREWNNDKLENLFEYGGSGGTPKSTVKEYYEGNIPFLSISDISNSDGYIKHTEKFISQKGLDNSAAWIVPKGAICLAMYASVGKLAILKIEVATSQAFYNMVFKDDNLRDFVYQSLLKTNELNEWDSLVSTGTQRNLNANKVKKFTLSVPSNDREVIKVSKLLMNIDKAINLHQSKLDNLIKLKTLYLNKMFI